MIKTIWRLKWAIVGFGLLAAAAWYWWTNIKEPDWRSAAIEDVAFIRDTIASDHPGMFDAQNPGFSQQLDMAFNAADARARVVEDAAGYFYATRSLTSAFEDAHLASQSYRQIPRNRRYPGFFVALDDDGAVRIAQRDSEQAPPLGAELVSCDGKDTATLYAERVAAFTHLSWLSGKRAGDMPWVLIDPGNPFLDEIKSCTFLAPGDTETRTHTLDWQPVDDDTRTAYLDGIEPRISQVTELSYPAPDTAWISIASFADSGEDVSEELAALIASIEERRAQIGAAQTLVIDVRGNLGGASAAGYAVAGALWGQDYVDARLPRFDTTDWRASDSNLDRIDDAMIPLRLRFGSDSALYGKVSAIRDGMQAANAAGDPLFVQPNPEPKPSEAAPLQLPQRIYLLTDSDCVSACLDFVDLVVTLPKVVHVGRETSGDTFYLEVVATDLPSGLGQLVYPTAIHRGRERGINESYVPAHRFDGDIRDREALLEWIAELPESA